MTEDTPATGNVLTNDSDADGNPLVVSGFSVGGNSYAPGQSASIAGVGTLVVNANGSYTFTPAPNYTGPVPVVSYTVSDGKGGSDSGTLTLGPVTPVNDAPVAVNDTAPVTEDTPATGNVLTNDSDVDGNPLVVSGFSVGGNSYAPGQSASIAGVGTLVVNANGSYTFTPAPNYTGPVPVVSYTVSDGQGGTDSGTLTLGPVTPANDNDAPLAEDDEFAVAQDHSIRIPILSNDSDPDGDPIRIVAIDGKAATVGVPIQVANGTVTVNADGSVTFIPTLGYQGPAEFSYTIEDGNGSQATAIVSGQVLANEVEFDPAFVPPSQLGILMPALFGDGMVGEAVGDLNGTMLSTDGMVDEVANSIHPLNGVADLGAQGMITQVLSQVDTWIGGEERLSDFTPGLLDGGSVVQAPASNGGTWFVVNSIIKEGVLNVLIAATTDQKGSGRTIDHTVTLADGRAVPDWLRVVRGSLIGQPPAGLPFIDIRIQTVDEGGKLLEDKLRIDLLSGAISEHAAEEQRSELAPALFSRQTMIGFESGFDHASNLAAALSNWSALREERMLN